ncbi:peptidylprolyl isomerase [Prevotella sp. HUN102]|uniref:peptidylprolyl isomerase n=1 Tax=Prevotella sp. HUN102 TaxID=1392486 RepID=UPI00048A91C9|nr:peptidylprolyl isomerase [Prevotella sp. HUN102]
MAALGKIRSRGAWLIIIIGLGLFAFIAEEAVRSCNGIKGEASQNIGEVLGEKVNVQEFQKMVEEFQNVNKIMSQRDNFTEDEMNQFRDQVWQQMVTNKVLERDAAKVGLAVTEDELNEVLKEGTNPMLVQSPFVNQQTGRFDVNALKQFLDGYNKAKASNSPELEQMQSFYDYWLFMEKTLRTQILGQKYQSLLASCVLSNKVEAKLAFKDENEEADVQLASLPYSSVKDADIKVSDEDLKAKYEELKPLFMQSVETRDIKYVDYQILPSVADRNAINKNMTALQAQLASAADPAQVVSKSGSIISYLGLPVSSKAYVAYPDIAGRIDSLAVGTTGVIENKADNTLNIIRVMSKVQLPDSVQIRQIQVAGATVEQSRQKADSIQKALAGGANFEEIAKRYAQTGEKTWFTNAYETATTISPENRQYVEAVLNGEVNAVQNLALSQGNVILQVLDKRAVSSKTLAAVIKKPIEFSNDTRSAAFNKFSEYVAKGTTIEELEKNAAKYGYKVQSQNNIATTVHNVVGIRSTREALKWIFDAKTGDVSPLYECGNNDHFMVVALTNIHPQGYRSWDDAEVKEMLKREVMKDKKAAQLMAKLKGVTNIAGAQAKGAKVSALNQVTFSAPAFVQETGSVEPALSGAIAATQAGKFSKNPVKGESGVYTFQVVKKAQRAGSKYDEAKMMQQCEQANLQHVGGFMQDLVLKAQVVDKRYLFF